MNRFVAALVLGVGAGVAGCAGPEVKYADLKPAPTATVFKETVIVHLGIDEKNPKGGVLAKARVKGDAVFVEGRGSAEKQRREVVVELPDTVKSQMVEVLWVEPNGRQVSVPVTRWDPTVKVARMGSVRPGRTVNFQGTWWMGGPYNVGWPCQILQDGADLAFINEKGESSSGVVVRKGAEVVALNWEGGIHGVVTEGGNRINWKNGTWWLRKK